MALTTCPFGHYFDDIKVKECPVCKKLATIADNDFGIQSQVTVSGYKLGAPTGGMTELLTPADANVASFDAFDVANEYDAMTDENSTIGFFDLSGIGSFTAGWLVCTAGEDRGKSFTISVGRNVCGSSAANDIVISDNEVIANMHCSFVYEPKLNNFYVTPDKGAVFYNGKFINKPMILKNNDKLCIGSSELVFVPFCNKNRSWNE